MAPDDDFFLLGGHSLLAISLLSKIETRLGPALDLDDFFDAATVRAVTAQVRAAGTKSVPPPAPTPTPTPTPTPAQPPENPRSEAEESAEALARLLDGF